MPKGDYPATGVIQIVRGGGAVTLRYVGVPAVSAEAEDEIQKAIDQFLDDCQTMIVWYAGIERLQDIIHQRLSADGLHTTIKHPDLVHRSMTWLQMPNP